MAAEMAGTFVPAEVSETGVRRKQGTTLDVEQRSADGEEGFQAEDIPLPALTIIALEELENNLAPFYLSRIIRQLQTCQTMNARRQSCRAILLAFSPAWSHKTCGIYVSFLKRAQHEFGKSRYPIQHRRQESLFERQ
jgi:hypothetical protein